MKLKRPAIVALVLLIIAASVYRVIPGMPAGFAPQIAMAIFGGAVFSDKKWALILPVLSLFISDLLFHGLYLAGLTPITGFYSGQISNYILFMLLTLFGSLMRRRTPLNIASFTISGSALYFLASNFLVWASGGGYVRPKTFDGLLLCYGDGLAFYRDYGLINGFAAGNLFIGDLFWSAIFFGAFYLIGKPVARTQTA